MAFKGWPAEAIEFFEGLEVDNSRAYFQANKTTYDEKVKRPMEELLDELKTAPKGYPKDHPRIELLRMKGLITWKQWPIARGVGTAKAKERIIEVLHAAKPINAWLDKHVGPTTMSMERR